jgi:hypothetical protein
MDNRPSETQAVPAEIVRALDESADDIREGRIGDARDLLAAAADRLRAMRERAGRGRRKA